MATLQKLPYATSCSTASSYGANSGKVDIFPAGLRVLVVDDDFTCLRIVEQMLRRCSYLGPCSTSSSVSSCVANADIGAIGRVPNLVLAFDDPSQVPVHVPHMNDFQSSYSEKSGPVFDHGTLKNPGFVGKEMRIPSRFAVDEVESPICSKRNIYRENDKKVKQEPNVDFIENANMSNSMLQHFSPNDIMSVFSE